MVLHISSNFQSNKSANESIEESQAALNFDDDEPVLNFESDQSKISETRPKVEKSQKKKHSIFDFRLYY